MFYEMFSAFANDGLNWGEFAFAVVLTAYGIYGLLWLLSGFLCYAYWFVNDKESAIQPFMYKFLLRFDSFGYVGTKHLTVDGYYVAKDVGYETAFRYVKIDSGKVVRRTDELPCHVTVKSVRDIKNTTVKGHIVWGLPAILTAIFLFVDLLPVVSLLMATVYGLLLLTRSVVRLNKKINKHIDDNGNHVKEKANEAA